MDIVLDVAFVLAVTAFLKEQFSLKGWVVIVVAFLIALFFGFAPLIMAMFPTASPFLEVFLNTLVLFLGAVGGYDAVIGFTRKKSK